MASYQQWLSKPETKRVTWVCGPEVVLREEVVAHAREELKPSDLDYQVFLGGSDKDKDIWAAANQYPMAPNANRLILVRDAERIKSWKPLEHWFENTRTLPTVYLLFVSGEADLPYVLDNQRRKTSELKPHAALIRDKAGGGLVRCTAPSTEIPVKDGKRRPGPSDMAAWIQRMAPLSADAAEYLYDRAGGNLGTVINVCRKAQLFSGELKPAVIDLLCPDSPSDDYVMSLLATKKARAFLSLEALHPSEYMRTIGLLEYQLDQLGKIHALLRQRKTMREIAQVVPVFAARQLVPFAKIYDPARRDHCRQVLSTADEALRSGVSLGPMECLTALW